jgi:hypothetical protein
MISSGEEEVFLCLSLLPCSFTLGAKGKKCKHKSCWRLMRRLRNFLFDGFSKKLDSHGIGKMWL